MALLSFKKKAPALKKRVPTPKLEQTTIRDFGGGLNVIDTELNLSSRYAPIADNWVRFADGSAAPRFGFEMWLKLHQGTESSGVMPGGTTITTANNSRILLINWTAHPFGSGGHEHITISGSGAVNGIPASDINRTHSVRYVSANQIAIVVKTPATSTSSPAFVHPYTKDNHALGGKVVDGFAFSTYLFIVSDIGEIVLVNEDRTIARVWDATVANGLGGSPLPWGATDYVTFDYWSGTVIFDNGYDKPLIIDPTKSAIVDYLVDPGNSSSNTKIPAFDLCKSAFRYFVIHPTEDVDGATDVRTMLRISAKNTSMVFAGAPSPGDAVDIDIARLMASMEPTLTGLAVIKDLLLVMTPTASVLIKLGTYVNPVGTTDSVHEPTPGDVMQNFGTSAPRTVTEVGNDVFMVDYGGVPSARMSQMQNNIVPDRVSDLVEPMMSAHIGRLSATTLRLHAFATFDSKNHSLHIYLPKYDPDDIRLLAANPFIVNNAFVGTQQLILFARDHKFEEGDYLDITGATAFSGIDAGWLNGRRRVAGVVSEDYVVLDIGGTVPTIDAQSGGGAAVEIQPVDDETIGYIYHYVPKLKINAWSRFRGIKLNAGCTSVEGRTFFFTDNKVMRYGTLDEPVYGDFYNDFEANWATNTAYAIGYRARDSVTGAVYLCAQAHTSASSGAFSADREAHPDYWTEYEGEPIKLTWELPWADFNKRQETKSMRHISVDSAGTATFTISTFVDNIYRDKSNGQLQPVRMIQFVGGDSGGYGSGDQPYGGGRRTREQFLWEHPIRAKLFKFRVEAYTNKPLRISAISFTYRRGSLTKT